MDETLKLAYSKSLQSIVGQLDAIFTLQAKDELQTAKIEGLEAKVAELEQELEGETATIDLDV